jgi:hypothetical protein
MFEEGEVIGAAAMISTTEPLNVDISKCVMLLQYHTKRLFCSHFMISSSDISEEVAYRQERIMQFISVLSSASIFCPLPTIAFTFHFRPQHLSAHITLEL